MPWFMWHNGERSYFTQSEMRKKRDEMLGETYAIKGIWKRFWFPIHSLEVDGKWLQRVNNPSWIGSYFLRLNSDLARLGKTYPILWQVNRLVVLKIVRFLDAIEK